jgi:hypothetical protein
MTSPTEVTVDLSISTKLTFIDRDNASWTVDEGLLDNDPELPILRLKVVEDDGIPTQIVFHKDDAAFIAWLIKHAAGIE